MSFAELSAGAWAGAWDAVGAVNAAVGAAGAQVAQAPQTPPPQTQAQMAQMPQMPQMPRMPKERRGKPRGFSVAKVAGVGVAVAALGALFALTTWKGPRVLTAPLFLAALASTVVVLVVTDAGRVALEKTARGSLWLVNRAVCAADDAVCAARAVYATGLVWLLACCVAVLYLLRWFIR